MINPADTSPSLPRMPRDTDIHPTQTASREAHSASMLRVLATYGCAFLLGFLLSAWTAPGSMEAAFLAAFLLTAGLVVARYALEIVMLPVVVVVWLAGRVFGRRGTNPGGGSWDTRMAAAVFVIAYLFVSLFTGGVIGAFPGGFGIVSSALLFGVAGLVYAFAVRRIAVHDLTTDEATISEPAARDAGTTPDDPLPAVTELSKRFADKMRGSR